MDVDPAMVGKEIHGVRVFGVLDDIPAIIRRMEIAIVILAIPEIQPNDLKKILEAQKKYGPKENPQPVNIGIEITTAYQQQDGQQGKT